MIRTCSKPIETFKKKGSMHGYAWLHEARATEYLFQLIVEVQPHRESACRNSMLRRRLPQSLKTCVFQNKNSSTGRVAPAHISVNDRPIWGIKKKTTFYPLVI